MELNCLRSGVVDGKVPISVAAATIFLTSQVIGSPKAVKGAHDR